MGRSVRTGRHSSVSSDSFDKHVFTRPAVRRPIDDKKCDLGEMESYKRGDKGK